MIRDAIRTTMLALAFLCALPAGADYAAGQQAWDAGRPDEALAQWRAAADAGDRRAMLALGRLFAEGLGAPQDYVEAHKWFNLAASRGEMAAVGERDALAAKMTPQQVAAAQERAAAWRPGADGLRLARKYPAGTKLRDCDECPELVVVPPGTYQMGLSESVSEEELEYFFVDSARPVHRVTIARPFAVGAYEVTRGEYVRFVSASGHSTGNSCWTYDSEDDEDPWKERSGRSWRNPGFSQTDRDPVVCVSWQDAQAYVGWLSRETGHGYRLPSESEWEYAARAGTTTPYYWGADASIRCRYGNAVDASYERHIGFSLSDDGCDDGHIYTAPVGSFQANGFGLHDVHGNVWEWVDDCSNESYVGAPVDGSAWESGDCSVRELRGGSWLDEPRSLRSADRIRGTADDRFDDVGFRVARTLTP